MEFDFNKWNLNGTKDKVSAKPMPLLPEVGLPPQNKFMRGKEMLHISKNGTQSGFHLFKITYK